MKAPSCDQDAKTEPKYSRRAILKRLGIGAGFLPLLSTERARAAAPNGFRPASSPSPGRTASARPTSTHRRGGRAARDAAVDPVAARDLELEAAA